MDTNARAGVYRQGYTASVSVPLGRWASVFQAEVYNIAVCSKTVMETVRGNTNIVQYFAQIVMLPSKQP